MSIDRIAITNKYLDYISDIVNQGNMINGKNIWACHEHRVNMLDKGKRPPCHACKYVKRSMNILMDNMFTTERDVMKEDRILFLFKNSIKDNIRTTRVNHIRLLASNIASMGNIMFSCADSHIFSIDMLKKIAEVLEGGSDDKEKKESKNQLTSYIKNNDKLTRIDKAILYYLIAFRYYSIANLEKDASDCLLKILIIINNALSVDTKAIITHEINNRTKISQSHTYKYIYLTMRKLCDKLFPRYAKMVNRQGAYSGHSEVQDIRKILHMHDEEYINLTRSHLYSELIEVIWHIVDSDIRLLNGLKDSGCTKVMIAGKSRDINTVISNTIINAYNHFKYTCMPHNTFYSEVIFYFAKFSINNYILNDIWNITKNNNNKIEAKDNEAEDNRFEIRFLRNYRKFLISSGHFDKYSATFNIDLALKKNRQDLIEFLIEDSIICLSEILYKLTPFNHISSFSNHFVAGTYNSLWEYAKMYETLGLLYDYREYQDTSIFETLFKYWIKTKSSKDIVFQDEIIRCQPFISEDCNLRDKYGSLRNRMFTRLKHNIDDRTLKYTISYHAAEMALRYYSLVESGYSEGISYRNQISRNYLLNDDLDNDTWLFNTAIERFRINSGNIKTRKKELAKAITSSLFYTYKSYFRELDQETEQFDIFDEIRFEDSLFTNTEL